jgi:hypothetical protein
MSRMGPRCKEFVAGDRYCRLAAAQLVTDATGFQ